MFKITILNVNTHETLEFYNFKRFLKPFNFAIMKFTLFFAIFAFSAQNGLFSSCFSYWKHWLLKSCTNKMNLFKTFKWQNVFLTWCVPYISHSKNDQENAIFWFFFINFKKASYLTFQIVQINQIIRIKK